MWIDARGVLQTVIATHRKWCTLLFSVSVRSIWNECLLFFFSFIQRAFTPNFFQLQKEGSDELHCKCSLSSAPWGAALLSRLSRHCQRYSHMIDCSHIVQVLVLVLDQEWLAFSVLEHLSLHHIKYPLNNRLVLAVLEASILTVLRITWDLHWPV